MSGEVQRVPREARGCGLEPVKDRTLTSSHIDQQSGSVEAHGMKTALSKGEYLATFAEPEHRLKEDES